MYVVVVYQMYFSGLHFDLLTDGHTTDDTVETKTLANTSRGLNLTSRELNLTSRGLNLTSSAVHNALISA